MTNQEKADRLNKMFSNNILMTISEVNYCLKNGLAINYKGCLLKNLKQSSKYNTKMLRVINTVKTNNFSNLSFYRQMKSINHNQLDFLNSRGVTL